MLNKTIASRFFCFFPLLFLIFNNFLKALDCKTNQSTLISSSLTKQNLNQELLEINVKDRRMKNLIKAFKALNLNDKCKNLLLAIKELGTENNPIGIIAKVSKTGKQGFNILGIDVANKSRLLDIPEVADLLEEVQASANLNYMIFQGDNYDKPGIWIGEKSQASSLSTEDLKQALFEA